jgi:hypothetical protein
LNPEAIRATLRDLRGFDHIGWMIRLSGIFGAVARLSAARLFPSGESGG